MPAISLQCGLQGPETCPGWEGAVGYANEYYCAHTLALTVSPGQVPP